MNQAGDVSVEKGRWYPEMPPFLRGETVYEYTIRLTGDLGPGLRPYNHPRNRQCSIGYHEECSDPAGIDCHCPCHDPEHIALVDRVARELEGTILDEADRRRAAARAAVATIWFLVQATEMFRRKQYGHVETLINNINEEYLED